MFLKYCQGRTNLKGWQPAVLETCSEEIGIGSGLQLQHEGKRPYQRVCMYWSEWNLLPVQKLRQMTPIRG